MTVQLYADINVDTASPAAPVAHQAGDGVWVIRFSSADRAWELECPASAVAGLPVRVHLVEVGSRRGTEASALVPWGVYRDALDTLLDGRVESASRTRQALDTLLRWGFSPLGAALDR